MVSEKVPDMYILPSDVSFSVLCKLREQQITDIFQNSVFFQTCVFTDRFGYQESSGYVYSTKCCFFLCLKPVYLLIRYVSEKVRAMYIAQSVASFSVVLSMFRVCCAFISACFYVYFFPHLYKWFKHILPLSAFIRNA